VTDEVIDPAVLEDMMFLALRRPAMKWGVPYLGCLMNLSVSLIVAAIIGKHSLMMFAYFPSLAVPTHLLMRITFSKDYHRLNCWMVWLYTAAKDGFDGYWGGSSLSPLTVKWPRKLRDFSFHV
jgi:type IV secretion system protein VirB3